MPFFVDALVVGANTNHAVALEQKLGAGEPGEHRDPGFLDLAAQPLHELVQRDDIVAVVAQKRRRNRELEFRFLGKEVNRFLRDLSVERRIFLEIRQQLRNRARIEQGPRETVLSNLTRLLQYVDVFFAEL